MKKYEFIKKVESLISPKDIATLQAMTPFAKMLPKSLLNKIIISSAKKNSYMGFVVEPYSAFLCYEIKDLDWARKLLPDNFELIKSSIFKDDEPKYYMIFGSFNVHTSAFAGTRLEVNIIAKNKKNNLLSWVIVDYDTNALSHDLSRGIIDSTTSKALVTTDFDGNIIVDVENDKENRALIYSCSTQEAKEMPLGQKLWMEGNLSVAYGRKLSENSSDSFSLKFDPKEVEKAFSVPLENLEIEKNTWFEGLFNEKPECLVYFPYAQHYLSDSPGHYSETSSEEEMLEQLNALDLERMPDYSAAPLRRLYAAGIILNLLFIVVLLVLLFLKG